MSTLLRLTRSLRTFRNSQTTRTMPSHFFHRSNSPDHLCLARLRFYSTRGLKPSGRSQVTSTRGVKPGGPSQVTSNLTVLYTLMGTNLAVFGYAGYLQQAAMQGHPKPFMTFLQNMTINLQDFQSGRWWTLLTANFTHLNIGHLFGNMFTTYFLGGFLASAPQITPGRFLVIALGSGLSGMVGYLYNRYLQTKSLGMRDNTRGVGFSGALMGISSVAACLAPQARVAIWGIIPMPLWALVAGYAVYDGYYVNSADSRVGHAGHLGGLAFGMAYYFARLRGLRI